MTLHVDDERAGRLARELAQTTGETVTQAVTRALEERLARERGRSGAELEARRRALIELVEQIARLPVLDSRTPDEIIGYDQNGIPT